MRDIGEGEIMKSLEINREQKIEWFRKDDKVVLRVIAFDQVIAFLLSAEQGKVIAEGLLEISDEAWSDREGKEITQ